MNFNLVSILKARCPACHQGPVLKNVFGIHPECSRCGHNFNPEPGFYLGAMAVSFLLTAMLTVPPMIALKFMDADISVILAFPFFEFMILGSFLLVYSRVLWLHLEYRMTTKLQGSYKQKDF
jgi:uncharacterized protein (DUF983 family)